MTLNTYGHVIAELADAEKVSAEELIRRARASIRPIDDAEHRDRNSRETRKPRAVAGRSDESPLPDSNRRPLPYHEVRGRHRFPGSPGSPMSAGHSGHDGTSRTL